MSIEEKISAYVDGELGDAERADMEILLQSDSSAMQILQDMLAADAHARENFAAALEAPVPLALAHAIMNAQEPGAKPAATQDNDRYWSLPRAVAAGIVLCIAAGIAGYGGYKAGAGGSAAPVVAAAPGWLDDIADYHRVYAAEKRHLVEVQPNEVDHIESWLGNRTNTAFAVPSLQSRGLTFEGARMLVAAGKPVAQLMYRDSQGAVIALCFTSSTTPADGAVTFKTSKFNDIEMVSWKKAGSSFVVVGPAGNTNLKAIAEDASQAI